MKKIFAVVLSLLLLGTMLPVSASAETKNVKVYDTEELYKAVSDTDIDVIYCYGEFEISGEFTINKRIFLESGKIDIVEKSQVNITESGLLVVSGKNATVVNEGNITVIGGAVTVSENTEAGVIDVKDNGSVENGMENRGIVTLKNSAWRTGLNNSESPIKNNGEISVDELSHIYMQSSLELDEDSVFNMNGEAVLYPECTVTAENAKVSGLGNVIFYTPEKYVKNTKELFEKSGMTVDFSRVLLVYSFDAIPEYQGDVTDLYVFVDSDIVINTASQFRDKVIYLVDSSLIIKEEGSLFLDNACIRLFDVNKDTENDFELYGNVGIVNKGEISHFDNVVFHDGYFISYPVTGDADGFNDVTPADARLVLRYSASLENLSNMGCLYCDVNGDCVVNSADARLILRMTANLG